MCFHGDGHYLRWLSLASSIENDIGCSAMSVVPGGFDEDPSGVRVTGLSDRSLSFPVPAGTLCGYEPEVSHQCPGRSEPIDVTDFRKQCHRRQCSNTPEATESFYVSTVWWLLGIAIDIGIEGTPLHLEILQVLELGD